MSYNIKLIVEVGDGHLFWDTKDLLSAIKSVCHDEHGECFDGDHIRDDSEIDWQNDVIIGAADPEKLVEFASHMKKKTFSAARAIIKGTEYVNSLGDTLGEFLSKIEDTKDVGGDCTDTFRVANAFQMMDNEPCFMAPCAVCSMYGGWSCWPTETMMSAITKNPEDWVVAKVTLDY